MTISSRLVMVVRWAARVMGTLVVLLVVTIAIGEGLPNPLQQPAAVNVTFIALLAMLAGQVTAWWREGIGGALVLAGLAMFAIANRGITLNAVFAPMLLTGILHLFCWWSTPKKP